MNLLLDTNVLIDYIGGKAPFFADAQRIVAAGYFGDARLWASAQSFKDAYYVLARYVDQRRVQRALRRMLDVVSVVSLSAEDAARGLHLEWDDYEDCLIALCAVAVKADYLITRDSAGFARSAVPTASPAEWLALVQDERHLSYGAERIEL